MGKPGTLEHFESLSMSIDDFEKEQIKEVQAFCANMRNLPVGKHHHTDFYWFFLLGFWNETLEFRDEPKYEHFFPEWGLLRDN